MHPNETDAIQHAVTAWFSEVPYKLSAVEANAAKTPVVANAAILGPKLNAARDTYKKYKSAAPTEQEAIFKECLADGAANVLTISAQATGFVPGDVKDPNNAEKYRAYLRKVQTAPFFTTLLARTVELKNKSKDFNALIDAIADTFVGIADEDKKGVINSLGKLAKLATSTKETSQSEDLFLQSVINVGEDIEIFIYNSHVEMRSDTEKGSTTSQSTFLVSTLKIRLVKSVFVAHSEKIRKLVDDSVDDWLPKNETKEGFLKSNLCLVEAV